MFVKFAECVKIVKAAFPDYSGKRDIDLRADGMFDLTGRYWSDGSYNEYAIVRLADMAVQRVEQINPMYGLDNQYNVAIPAGFAVVCRRYRGTSGQSISIAVGADNVALFLPPPMAELTGEQKTVLYFTRACKGSYGGNPNYRQESSGLSAETWNRVKMELVQLGLLDKRGAMTTAGKNAASGLTDPRYLSLTDRPSSTPIGQLTQS